MFDDRRPLHWPLEFPEVSAQGGFDAIVGNPPFQGGQRITGALGTRYRDHLVGWVAGGVRGSADLVAYFFLRAGGLVRRGGGSGLVATNTLAQGDTREVGLDRLTEDGLTLHRAVASEPWPGGANLEMATVWGRSGEWTGESVGAALHAKALVVDGQRALVGSANLTQRALTANLEVGVLVRDPAVAGTIEAHVHELMADGVLTLA